MMRDMTGEGNYYLEIQDHGIPEQRQILPDLYRLSEETGIPLVAFPLSEEEERAKSEAFDWVVLQTYYKSFRFVTGQKDKDLANREPLDINNDEHWQNYLNWINTDGMLDEYIRLNEKKFFPDKQ